MFVPKILATSMMLLALLGAAHAQGVGWSPLNAADPITGSASAPITMPVVRTPNSLPSSDDPPTPPVALPTFTFTITGRDMDTYQYKDGKTQQQFYDRYFICQQKRAGWPTISGPTQRGIATDGTVTWDFVANGTSAKKAASRDAVVYQNVYTLGDLRPADDVLRDDPIDVIQIIISPALSPVP